MRYRILVLCFSFVLVFPRCNVMKSLGLVPSELEMAMGLREALSQGLWKGFDAFADPNGNPMVRFAFPGDAAKIEKTLNDLGLSKLVNQVTGKFTRAMASAVSASKPIFLDAVRSMSIRDAIGILITDNTHAATDYFKSAMQPSLITAFRPIVDSTIHTEGADKDWSSISTIYNKIPFTGKPLESSLTDFISARVIDLMFLSVANEETQIRQKYEFRKSDLTRKVFGYAEQELKRRKAMQ
ncbi:MAG: DUF4197 domain-containing protein [Chitinophagaceae bacterium]|nr:DUF4197 domain-containing protein [Chitinophagaceae bacterium]